MSFYRGVGRKLMGLQPDEAAIAAAMPKAQAVFEELARLLGERTYFTGEALSLADILVAPQLAFFTLTPEWAELGAPHANLAAWLARMEARPSMPAAPGERVSEVGRGAGALHAEAW